MLPEQGDLHMSGDLPHVPLALLAWAHYQLLESPGQNLLLS